MEFYEGIFETDRRTYIALEACDEEVDTEKVERMKNYNSGRYKSRDKVNKKQVRKEDAHAVLDGVASTLRLTKGQKREAKKLFSDLKSKQRGIETLAFAVCVIVVNRYVEGKRYWPGWSDNDERFEEFADDHDLDPLPAINQIKQEGQVG